MHDFRVPRPADDAAIDIAEIVLPFDQALGRAPGPEEAAAIEAQATRGQRLLSATIHSRASPGIFPAVTMTS